MKITSTDIETRREEIKTTRANRETLIDIYNITREKTPAETVKALVFHMGRDTAAETVAEMVNSVSEYDGRIYDYVRAWALSIETAETRETLNKHGFYMPNEIHPAHINQIGQEMQKYLNAPRKFKVVYSTSGWESGSGWSYQNDKYQTEELTEDVYNTLPKPSENAAAWLEWVVENTDFDELSEELREALKNGEEPRTDTQWTVQVFNADEGENAKPIEEGECWESELLKARFADTLNR